MAELGHWKRTIVRASFAGRRMSFRLLDRIAPARAARWAGAVWCTLPANGGRRRDERPRPGERSVLRLPDGRIVAVESWGFGPPVYLMHGWGGWRGQLGAFITPLVEAGRRVVAVDAPSHGESDPGVLGAGRGIGTEFVATLSAVAGKHGKPSAVVAHSFGCAAAAVAVEDGLPASKLVLIAPSVSLTAGLPPLRRALGFGDRTQARLIAQMQQVAGRPITDFDIVDLAARSEFPPALVVHDRQDKEVPYDDGVRLAAAWPDAELVSTDGLGHQRILRDPDVIKLVVDYVTALPHPNPRVDLGVVRRKPSEMPGRYPRNSKINKEDERGCGCGG